MYNLKCFINIIQRRIVVFNPIVISGPSGVGKDTLIKFIKKDFPNIREAVGYTTRSIREGEVAGEDLNFVDKDDFLNLIKNDQLIEYATFNNEYYGMGKNELEQAKSKLTIFNIGISAAHIIKNLVPKTITILLLPPSYDELVKRLGDRGLTRLRNIEKDLQYAATFFDYCLISETDKVGNVVNNFFDILNGNNEKFKIENFSSQINNIILESKEDMEPII